MNVIEDLRLKRLQQCAIHNVVARTSDANNATMATRIGELNSLHVAASMDIEKTTESLKEILAYKKEVAKQMLRCSSEEQMEHIAEIIKHADDMIKNVLGMYAYNVLIYPQNKSIIMTAKEKAKELIETSKDYVHGYIGSSFMTNYEYPEQILNQSKKVAKIIVDEIINEVKNGMYLDWIPTRKNGEEFVEYWVKVKKEIDDAVLA